MNMYNVKKSFALKEKYQSKTVAKEYATTMNSQQNVQNIKNYFD